ncbi:MAG: LysM peptidoglycan-binding domain-containing protein [Defluviitaleaceae bacterium]|nr:LysM peptidoglycan-binding domain-containing protein [Defluviitaleaceae bacterium]
MSDFFPQNIKQIGDIDEDLKIYLEDNVFNYLFEYSQKAGYEERIALLLGKKMKIEGRNVVFIEGAILGKYAEELNNILIPSEETESYAKEQLGINFRGMEIVGLMQSQPGYGVYLNPSYRSYMNQNFKKKHQVLFTIDPMEKSKAFYIRDDEGELKEAKGFIIYYEKNNQMVEYIQENPVDEELKQIKQLKPVKLKTSKEKSKYTEENYEDKKGTKKLNPKIDIKSQSKTINLLVTMCAVVVVISFVLAGALIRSEERLQALERDMQTITTAHISLVQSLQATQEAFAFMHGEIIRDATLIETDGQALAINPQIIHESQAPPAQMPIASSQTYIVQPGDSLISISNMFFGENRIYDIMAINELQDPHTIFAGMLLVLPE